MAGTRREEEEAGRRREEEGAVVPLVCTCLRGIVLVGGVGSLTRGRLPGRPTRGAIGAICCISRTAPICLHGASPWTGARPSPAMPASSSWGRWDPFHLSPGNLQEARGGSALCSSRQGRRSASLGWLWSWRWKRMRLTSRLAMLSLDDVVCGAAHVPITISHS